MAELAEHVAGWAPEPVEELDRLDPWPAQAFAAILDQPSPVRAQGDELPPGWHWFHHRENPDQSQLGEDGHPADGHFLPPIPQRRRMFAGARLEFREPLRIGAQVLRRTSVTTVTPKTGRSGEMLFVGVRHEFVQDGVTALVEDQDIVYRSQPPGGMRSAAPAAPGAPAPDPAPPADGAWRARLQPDAAMLFRFSAVTYNAHRIHYDEPYTTGVEGFPGLVVHGPLLALLLLELPRRHAPDRRVTAFSFRLRTPAFAGAELVADGVPDGSGAELSAGAAGAGASITGRVELA